MPPELPRHRNGTAPQGRSRFPDYNVLDEVGHWDEKTREVVLKRVEAVPEISFFTPDEVTVLRPFVEDFSQARLHGKPWAQVNVGFAWEIVHRDILAAFYSHPWAWNEIGFGGPAYPRGYMRLQPGPPGREPYEALEAFGVDPVKDVPQRGVE